MIDIKEESEKMGELFYHSNPHAIVQAKAIASFAQAVKEEALLLNRAIINSQKKQLDLWVNSYDKQKAVIKDLLEALNLEPVIESSAAESYIHVKKEYWNEVQRIRKEALSQYREAVNKIS